MFSNHSVKQLYQQRIRNNHLKVDTEQAHVIEQCHLFQHQLYRWYHHTASWLRYIPFYSHPRPQGLYIYGEVGRGKSMIMDLLYESTASIPKERLHFHEFMQDIHHRLHTLRQKMQTTDPIPIIAKQIRSSVTLLCFDEFHVTDITDAMIMSRLFTALFQEGVMIVATSNVPPENLYKDGLQREQFLPFITLLKEQMMILALNSPTDFRLRHLHHLGHMYLVPHHQHNNDILLRHFHELADNHTVQPATLSVKGHHLTIPITCNGMALLTFTELCGSALGAADYLQLARTYHTVFLLDIPLFTADLNNEAKRFITLIDVLYEHNTKLLCTAAAEAKALYHHGKYAFEFQRTASRLMEMQSEHYVRQSKSE